MDRIITQYIGQEHGTLFIIIGGMHGNEHAGVRAIELMGKMLEVEPITNPDFLYRGMVLGILGNVSAYNAGSRYIQRDLNRMWIPELVDQVMSEDPDDLSAEYKEMREIITLIRNTIEAYGPTRVVVLDLHTTSSRGGIFSICTQAKESVDIAVGLHAPVVTGMIEGMQGTSLHYFNIKNLGVDTITVVFESGQHDEPLSVNRAIASIINCMRAIGGVDAEVVENQHDHLLITYGANLPKVTRLIYKHKRTSQQDDFMMLPDFKNFQPIKKGQLLAHDGDGGIYAQCDGLILMPLYQPQGEDGFFVVEAIE